MRAALVIAVVWTAACGGNGVDIEDAPEVARGALCRHAAACGLFPDKATCLASNFGVTFNLDPSLVIAINEGRVKYDGSKLGDCYDAFGDATCDRTDVDGRTLLAGCSGAIEGTIGDGGACSIEEECISGVCNFTDCPDACCPGTCLGSTAPNREAEIGEVCGEEAVCVAGAYCADTMCVALKPADAPCLSSFECDYGLGCAGTPRQCKALPKLGEPCAADSTCRDEGQYCNPMTMVCTHVGLPGDACSTTARCSMYYECDPASMTCTRGAAVGEACTGTSDCFDYGTYCKANLCAPLEPNGAACADDDECTSGFCGLAGTCVDEPTCP